MSAAKTETGEKNEPVVVEVAEAIETGDAPETGPEADDTVAVIKETSFDAVITRVLDASDVANKTASIAADSTEHLIDAVGELREATVNARMHAVIVLGATGFLMLIAVGVFILMALQLQGRLDSADATILAVGKRVVTLNSSIGSLKEMESVLEKFNERQEGQAAIIEKTLPRFDAGVAELRKSVSDLAEKVEKAAKTPPPPPPAPAKPVAVVPPPPPPPDPRIQVMQAQLKALEPQMQAQARATAKLGEQLAAMQASLGKMNAISHDLETLIKQERQRAVVAVTPPVVVAPAAKEPAKAERPPSNFVRYPNLPARPLARDASEAATGATPQP
ncbi:MAG: hypothetical protein WCK07_16195 [Betaproteobacteria bacterium]